MFNENATGYLPKNLHNYSTHKPDNRLAEYLYENKDVLKFAIEKNKAQKECVINYLKNTIDCTDDKFAFVDLKKEKIVELIKPSNLYYDSVMEKIYLSKEYYYDEI